MEIKKEWSKMSRQIKKIGLNHTCVMNARQQRLGTATILVDFVENADPAQRKRGREAYKELVMAAPVQNFLSVSGASVALEEVPYGYYTKVYARFYYAPVKEVAR